MIGKLTGVLDSTGEDWAMIDVGGVGYVAFCSRRGLGDLPAPGQPASLHIETQVREDRIHLYGFIDRAERDWFRLLSTVQGVGAKMALAILSVLPPDALVQAIAAQDKSALTRANGVGPKLGGRIVSELRDKASGFELGTTARRPAAKGKGAAAKPDDGALGMAEDAVSALVNLGYKRGEAFGAVTEAARALGESGESASLEVLIRAGLKELSA